MAVDDVLSSVEKATATNNNKYRISAIGEYFKAISFMVSNRLISGKNNIEYIISAPA